MVRTRPASPGIDLAPRRRGRPRARAPGGRRASGSTTPRSRRHALRDLRDQRLLAPAVGDVARHQHQAGLAADLDPLAGEQERAPAAVLHDELDLEVAHASLPPTMRRTQTSRCDGSAHRPSSTGVRPITSDSANPETARNLSFTRRMRLSPRRTTAIGSGLERMAPEKSSCDLLQARAGRAQRLVHQHGRRDVGERGRELLLVRGPLAPLAHRLQAHHALRLALLPDARVQHRDDAVPRRGTRRRTRGSAGRRPHRSRGACGSSAGRGNRPGSFGPPAPRRTRAAPRRGRRGPPGAGSRGPRRESRSRRAPPPASAPAASVIARQAVSAPAVGTPALQQREERGLLRLRPESGCLSSTVHALLPWRPRPRSSPFRASRDPILGGQHAARQSPAGCPASRAARCAAQRSNSSAAIGAPTW